MYIHEHIKRYYEKALEDLVNKHRKKAVNPVVEWSERLTFDHKVLGSNLSLPD